MKISHAILLAACSAVYLASCTKDKAEEKIAGVDSTCTHNKQDTMSYTNDIVPIMQTYCTDPALGDCHSPSSSLGWDFSTYAGLATQLPDLFNYYVLDPATATMPKSITTGATQLTACEKEKLQLWIDQGYPDN
jgi:hypothetical protein